MKSKDINARLGRVRLVAFDCDGVLTSGAIVLTATGGEIKAFNVHDGVGIKYLQRAGILTAILSGRRSRPVQQRAKQLGMTYCLQGFKRKLDGLEKLVRRSGVGPNEICFVGDDLPDIPVMRRVGLAVAVANARPEVKRVAQIVTRTAGGGGAAREIAQRILKVQRKWGAIVKRYGLDARGRTVGGDQ